MSILNMYIATYCYSQISNLEITWGTQKDVHGHNAYLCHFTKDTWASADFDVHKSLESVLCA